MKIFEAFIETVFVVTLVVLTAFFASKMPACDVSAATVKPGVERWPVKVMAPEDGLSTFVDLITLMHLSFDPPGLGKSYREKRVTAAEWTSSLTHVHEGSRVTTGGYLRLIAAENDGDYHMQLTDEPDGTTCLIAETPDPRFVPEPLLRERVLFVRKYLQGLLGTKHPPSASGTLVMPPISVCIAGAIFNDASHVDKDGSLQPRGKRGMVATSAVELHPVDVIWVNDGSGCAEGPPSIRGGE